MFTILFLIKIGIFDVLKRSQIGRNIKIRFRLPKGIKMKTLRNHFILSFKKVIQAKKADFKRKLTLHRVAKPLMAKMLSL